MSEEPLAPDVVSATARAGLGVALLCDAQTIIRHVIRDDVGLPDRAEPRRSFASLVDADNSDKARRFLGAVTTHGVAFDWGMMIATADGGVRLRFAGTTTSTGMLVVGAVSAPALGTICRELLDSGDDAVRGIRSDLRALMMQAESAPAADQDLEDELTRLREELAALRRELDRRGERGDPPGGDRLPADLVAQAWLPADLPQHPQLALTAARVAGTRSPAAAFSWYDAFPLPDGRIAVAAAHVGAGGPRGLATMTEVRAAIRALAIDGQAPFSVLSRTDRVLRLSSTALPPATAVLGVLDPGAMVVTYSIAGHPPPLLVSEAGAERLRGTGWPVGARSGELRPSRTVRLPERSLLVFYAGALVPGTAPAAEEAVEQIAAAARAEHADGRPDPAHALSRRLFRDTPPLEDAAILAVSVHRRT